MVKNNLKEDPKEKNLFDSINKVFHFLSFNNLGKL